MPKRQYIARIAERLTGLPTYVSTPHDTREAAAREAFAARPMAAWAYTTIAINGEPSLEGIVSHHRDEV